MAQEQSGGAAALAQRLVERVVEIGIHGRGPLQGAVAVAQEHLAAAGGDREQAARRLVATHVRLAAVSGFVTGLGGFATLPVAVTASTTGLYILATRMCAGIAHLRGYDIDTEEVRSAILVSLLGSAGASTLRKAGVRVGQQVSAAALERVPARLLLEINKRVGVQLLVRAGEQGVLNLAKWVPLVGGPIGATIDGVSCKTIGGYALRTFDPLPPAAGTPAAPGAGGDQPEPRADSASQA